MEINRFIRILNDVAERHKGNDLFIKVYSEGGSLVDPNPDNFSFYNDYSDRLVIITNEDN